MALTSNLVTTLMLLRTHYIDYFENSWIMICGQRQWCVFLNLLTATNISIAEI